MIDLFPNETVLFQWLIFMTALVTLHWGIFRPVLKILAARNSRTSGAREAAKLSDERSEDLLKTCEERMEAARIAGIRKKEEIRGVAERQVDGLLKKTRAEIDRKMEDLQRQIERQARESSLQLKQYAQGLSREIASRILEREV